MTGFLDNTAFLIATWSLAGAVVLYVLHRWLSGPGMAQDGLLVAVRRVVAQLGKGALVVGAWLTMLSVATIIGGAPGVIGAAGQFLLVATTWPFAALLSLYLARQFMAPSWWRMNAWTTSQETYDGSVREIVRWILLDARRMVQELRPVDRLVVAIGAPALIFDLALVVGADRALIAVLLTLLVCYVALGVALLTANRIPRVLMSRLVELRGVARAIASGDLAARAGYNDMGDYEELAELVADINGMARSLQAREAENLMLHQQLQQNLLAEQERATRDPLTALRNHRYFQESLQSELYRCARTGGQCTIAIIDLDNFKLVNDQFGHQEGDSVLIRVTQSLQQNLRPYDLACRLGGEEFGVVFPETGAEEAKLVLDRLLLGLDAAGPKGGPCTFSGGLATYPSHAQDQATLYQLADEAAYSAKSRGKAQTVIYDPMSVASMGSAERAHQKEREALLSTAKTLVTTVDAKDSLARNHSELVGRYSSAIAAAMGYEEDFVSRMYLCGLLHDVGKIGIDDAIVMKAGRLTSDEYEQVKRHPELSFQIVNNAGMSDVAVWVRHHHEHWDGSGYPYALAGEEIPVASRIVLVAEAFEVMTSDRVYRRALTAEQAIEELRSGAGRMFDPAVVDAMVLLTSGGAVRAGATDPALVAQAAARVEAQPAPAQGSPPMPPGELRPVGSGVFELVPAGGDMPTLPSFVGDGRRPAGEEQRSQARPASAQPATAAERAPATAAEPPPSNHDAAPAIGRPSSGSASGDVDDAPPLRKPQLVSPALLEVDEQLDMRMKEPALPPIRSQADAPAAGREEQPGLTNMAAQPEVPAAPAEAQQPAVQVRVAGQRLNQYGYPVEPVIGLDPSAADADRDAA